MEQNFKRVITPYIGDRTLNRSKELFKFQVNTHQTALTATFSPLLRQYWPDELMNVLAIGYSVCLSPWHPLSKVSIMPLGLLSKDLPECFYCGISGDIISKKELTLQKVSQKGHIHQHPEAAGVSDYRTAQCLLQSHLWGSLVGCAKVFSINEYQTVLFLTV